MNVKVLESSGPADAELGDEVEGFPSDDAVKQALDEQRSRLEAALGRESAQLELEVP